MAKRVPIMETGMVDPSMPTRTDGNCVYGKVGAINDVHA
jgi:hypothetical protein